MQDLLVVGPFIGTGIALILVGLVSSHQNTLSARRLDQMVAAKPKIAEASMYGSVTAVAEVNAQVSAPKRKEVTTY
jgi:hypothetical protein